MNHNPSTDSPSDHHPQTTTTARTHRSTTPTPLVIFVVASTLISSLLFLGGVLLFGVAPILTALPFLVAAALLLPNFTMVMALIGFPLGRRTFSKPTLLYWQLVFRLLKLNSKLLVELNNVGSARARVAASESHVLASKCLQLSTCRCQVTTDIEHCRECGKCPIGDIRLICREAGISASVESGGTSARLQIQRRRPRLVLAIACERELMMGILDTKPPVLGVMLREGDRPCLESTMNPDRLRQALDHCLTDQR